jgi:hypothetical protein
MDINVLKNQIGIGNLMAVGAREFVRDENSLMFRVSRGMQKLIVTLEPDDTYSVRYVKMKARTYEVVADETVAGVYADNIGAVVRRLGDR